MPAYTRPPEKTAVSYSRVACADQQRHRVADRQLEECRQIAQRLGVTVAHEFADLGQSGTTLERPGMRALLNEVATGRYDYLICTDAARIARNLKLLTQVLEHLDLHRTQLALSSTLDPTDLVGGMPDLATGDRKNV